MSRIISISTKIPEYRHRQQELYGFAERIYCRDDEERRKLKFLYRQSGIESRYSVIPDFSSSAEEREFFPASADLEPFPGIESRMKLYHKAAPVLSAQAIDSCISGKIAKEEITHLVTVSCTGMSAPGLDLQLVEAMGLSANIVRTSVNFMGCYAAIHGMKLADAFCKSDPRANVVVVCTELCTLHFQKEATTDNITSSLLFSDGVAAMLIQPALTEHKGICIENFFSSISFRGKQEMAWELSSTGFLMTITGYVPELIREDFRSLVESSLHRSRKIIQDITHWCIHPGGKKILDTIAGSLGLEETAMKHSYGVLNDYGNMSSPTILFVLKRIMDELEQQDQPKPAVIFGAAFGPGLTMETFTASYG